MSRFPGTFQRLTIDGEVVRAFVPAPLPPAKPALELDGRATKLLGGAEEELKRLDGMKGAVPGLGWLDQALAAKEAVASARLAGSQASLADAFPSAFPSVTDDGRTEAGNIADALAHNRQELDRPASGTWISVRLLSRTHRRVMQGLRDQATAPGRLRSTPTWVGAARPSNATYVPPPPSEIGPLLEQLDVYLTGGSRLPPLVRIAMVHAQFASIRPYLDGNGRVGGVLLALLLERSRYLRAPILCLSVFLNRHRADYLRLLAAVRTDGDWESWVAFFLEGVATMAAEGVETSRSLLEQVARDQELMLRDPRASVAGLRLFAKLPEHPIVSVPMVAGLLETTTPTAAKAVALLESLGLLRESSGRKRDRRFSYERFLELLGSGME